ALIGSGTRPGGLAAGAGVGSPRRARGTGRDGDDVWRTGRGAGNCRAAFRDLRSAERTPAARMDLSRWGRGGRGTGRIDPGVARLPQRIAGWPGDPALALGLE